MADETNNNEATELVGDHVETVDVSKHPDPSIPVTDLSLADIERRQSHPVPWAVFIVAVLAAIIAPTPSVSGLSAKRMRPTTGVPWRSATRNG